MPYRCVALAAACVVVAVAGSACCGVPDTVAPRGSGGTAVDTHDGGGAADDGDAQHPGANPRPNAFVTFLYGDEEPGLWSEFIPGTNLLAARVLIRSIRESGSHGSPVVAASPSLPIAVVALLVSEGATVLPMPQLQHPASLPGVSPELVHVRNRLHLWSLTQYRRIVFLEDMHHVLLNVDHVFECEAFCSVPWAFVRPSSPWVVTPGDRATFELVSRSLAKPLPSVEAAVSRGLFPELQQALEEARLFPSPDGTEDAGNASTAAAPSAGPQLRRLMACYNLPFLYYIERMNWSLMRCGPLANNTVPGWVLSFRNTPNVLGVNMFVWYWFVPRWVPVRSTWNQHRYATPVARPAAARALAQWSRHCRSPGAHLPSGFASWTCRDVLAQPAADAALRVGLYDAPPALHTPVVVMVAVWVLERVLVEVHKRWGVVPLRWPCAWLARLCTSFALLRAVVVAGIVATIAVATVEYIPIVCDPSAAWLPMFVSVLTGVVSVSRLLPTLRGDFGAVPSFGSFVPLVVYMAVLAAVWGFSQAVMHPWLGALHGPVMFAYLVFVAPLGSATLFLVVHLLSYIRAAVVVVPAAKPKAD